MKKILIPIDLAESTESLYHLASKIAKTTNSEITFLFCVNEDANSFLFGSDMATPIMHKTPINMEHIDSVENKEAQAKIILDRIKDSSNFEQVETKSSVVTSSLVEFDAEVANYSKRRDFDLIVLGSNVSANNFNSYEIARKTDVPILMIPDAYEKQGIEPFNKTLIPVDFNNLNDKYFNSIEMIIIPFHSTVEFLHINTPDNFLTTKELDKRWSFLEKRYNLSNLYSFKTINANSVEEAIDDYSKEGGFDLITISTHGREGIDSIFQHSYTESLLNKVHLPTFVFNVEKNTNKKESSRKTHAITPGFVG